MSRNQLKDILDKIKTDVREVVKNEVTDAIKEVYREEVDYMYNEYTPETYARRYEKGGFSDEENWKATVDPKGDMIYFEFENKSKATNSTIELDKIIEEGIYDWRKYPPPRPVYERTSLRLNSGNVVENGLTSGLKARGYKVVKK